VGIGGGARDGAERVRDPYFVQSLERGLAVIRAFDADNPAMTLSDVARRTGMTRAAARRFLLTLADLGYVRTDGRQFMLSPRVLDLGYAYLSGAGLPAVAEPHLEALVAEVHQTSSVAVLDGDDVVYVARVAVRRIVNIAIAVIIAIDMAKSFGQTPAFGVVLLFFLSVIGYLILGFGSAQYVGPAAAPPQARAAAV